MDGTVQYFVKLCTYTQSCEREREGVGGLNMGRQGLCNGMENVEGKWVNELDSYNNNKEESVTCCF